MRVVPGGFGARAGGLRSLLMKGAALARTHYARPWHRPRDDADLLIHGDDREAACDIMTRLGYQLSTHFSGELVTFQEAWEYADRVGYLHFVDMHVKGVNPLVLADAFAYDQLAPRAVPISVGKRVVQALAPVDALLLACVHRVAHHAGRDRLIWLVDIHRLIDAMDDIELDDVVHRAQSLRVTGVVLAGMTQARRALHTRVPKSVTRRLGETAADEPSRVFLRSNLTTAHILLSDLRQLSGWRRRLQLVREHLFPPVVYMRATYDTHSALLLPMRYVTRIGAGVTKWFR